ncbi:MAG: helix-turn-helix transcriptional regulator [Victivallales bacterium]|nr:helix-turn-helix transcriptional regulator [Victivallales bacterium]
MDNEAYPFFFPGQEIPLPCELINCGHELVQSKAYRHHGLQRGTREFLIWQCTLSGTGALQAGDRHWMLPPGRALLVKVPSDHIYYFPGETPHWEFLYVTFAGPEIVRLGELLMSRHGSVLEQSAESATVRYAWNLLRLSRLHQISDPFQASAHAYHFLLTCFSDLESQRTRTPEQALLNKVTAWVTGHLTSAITIEQLAEQFGYSRSHFSRLFHTAAGMTAQEYLRRLRIQMAISLLQTEPLSIKEIAARVGFDDPSYFCRVFRHLQGQTPERFRSGHHEESKP